MKEKKLLLLTNITAGVFILATITSAVLALAIWDYRHHQTLWNVAYYCSVVVSILISTIIVVMLLRGIRHNQPHLMLPFIVYCSLQASVSFLLLSFFATTAFLQYWLSGTLPTHSIQLIAIFILESLYWIISLHIAHQQQQQFRESAWQHYKLVP